MREIFSVRFFIAIGAVAGLLFLLFTFFGARDVVDQANSDTGADAAQPEPHASELVGVGSGAKDRAFGVAAEGEACG